ncbi:MAG: hypothetical protein KAS32_22880, partial [Candidatus Peribacteraceae bacterium]|nr:hypothetical protein [Candidatus Peribacteraceae bacterium]
FVYSLDRETFEDFDATQCQVDGEYESGVEVKGYMGKPIRVTHKDVVANLVSIPEQLRDLAAEDYGDFADDYLDGMTPELERGLLDAISQYLDNNVRQPSYYAVGEIEECIFVSDG